MPSDLVNRAQEQLLVLRDPKVVGKIYKKPEFQNTVETAISAVTEGVDTEHKLQVEIQNLREELQKNKDELRVAQSEWTAQSQQQTDDYNALRYEKEQVEQEILQVRQEVQEQVDFLTKELAAAEMRADENEKHMKVAMTNSKTHAEENEKVKARSKELEQSNFELLRHSEKQKHEISRLLEQNEIAKEKELKARQKEVTMSNALKEAHKRINDLTDLASRIQSIEVPVTPHLQERRPSGQGSLEGLRRDSQSPEKPSSRDGTKPFSRDGIRPGSRGKLEPLRLKNSLGTEELQMKKPDVSPISGYKEWRKFYNIELTPESTGADPTSLKNRWVNFLVSRFGSLPVGWKCMVSNIEPSSNQSGSMDITLEEFSQGCRDIGYEYNLKMTFHDIVNSFAGRMTLEMVDKEGYRVWQLLRLRLIDTFQTVGRGVRSIFGSQKAISSDQFLASLQKIKFPKAKRVLRYLSPTKDEVVLEAILTSEEAEQYRKESWDDSMSSSLGFLPSKGSADLTGMRHIHNGAMYNTTGNFGRRDHGMQMAAQQAPMLNRTTMITRLDGSSINPLLSSTVYSSTIPEDSQIDMGLNVPENFHGERMLMASQFESDMHNRHNSNLNGSLNSSMHSTINSGMNSSLNSSLNSSIHSNSMMRSPPQDSHMMRSPPQGDRQSLIEKFRKLLIGKYRNLSIAWKQALDPHSKGCCGFQEFAKVCRNLGFEGTKKLWKEFRPKNDIFYYADLDPVGCQLINDFKSLLLKRYNDLITAWVVGLDVDGTNRLDHHVFVDRLMSEYGYNEYTASTLFKHLKSDAGKKYLNLSDIDSRSGHLYINGFLPEDLQQKKRMEASSKSASQDAPQEASATSGSDDQQPRKRSLQGFLERQSSHEILNQRKEMAIEIKDRVSTRQQEAISKDMMASNLDEFISFLKRRYKNMPRAWRIAFDKDENGKVNLGEFTHVCRDLKAFKGNIGKLFKKLDTDGSGLLSLKELDPTSWNDLSIFQSRCEAEFGSKKRAWEAMVEEGSVKVVTSSRFVNFCEDRLGFGSGIRVFKYYLLEDGNGPLNQTDFLSLDCKRMEERKERRNSRSRECTSRESSRRSDRGGKYLMRMGATDNLSALDSSPTSSRQSTRQAGGHRAGSVQSDRFEGVFCQGVGLQGVSTASDSEGSYRDRDGVFPADPLINTIVNEKPWDGAGPFHDATTAYESAGETENSTNVFIPADNEEDLMGSKTSIGVTSEANTMPEGHSHHQFKKSVTGKEANQEDDMVLLRASHSGPLPQKDSHVEDTPAGEQKMSALLDQFAGDSDSEDENRSGRQTNSDSSSCKTTPRKAESSCESSASVVERRSSVLEDSVAVQNEIPTKPEGEEQAENPAPTAPSPTDLSTLLEELEKTPFPGEKWTDIDPFLETFRTYFGASSSLAWAFLFPDKEEVKFVEFCKGVRKLKFAGNLKILWGHFIGTKSGQETLQAGDIAKNIFL